MAAIFEIAGYYLPIIDNFLDTLATPAAVVAGTLITAAFLVDMEPWLQWVLGVVAGVVRPGCAGDHGCGRAASTVTTGGWAIRWWPRSRPATVFGSLLAVVIAPLALAVSVLLICAGVFIWIRRRRRPPRRHEDDTVIHNNRFVVMISPSPARLGRRKGVGRFSR